LKLDASPLRNNTITYNKLLLCCTKLDIYCQHFYTIMGPRIHKISFVVLLLFSFVTTAGAASYTWKGTSSTNWSTGANWSGGVVPAPTDNITIPAGTTFAPTVTASSSCNTITFTGNNTITISAGVTLTVGGNLTNLTAAVTANITMGAGAILDITNGIISNSGTFNVIGGGASAATIQLESGGPYITNSGIFTINNHCTVIAIGNGSTPTTSISNSGTFYAGTSNSTCAIQIDDSNSINNTGTFFLGSTSIISYFNTNAHDANIINAAGGVFTLQSDKWGSAAIDAVPQGQNDNVTGVFNVERFLSGGPVSTNRGYRLLSSPVNQIKAASGTPNTISLHYINTPIPYTTVNATLLLTNAGAFTGGPGGAGGGFSFALSNPTIYIYDESKAISNVSYTSGKHIGIMKITSTNVDLSNGMLAKSIPVGNGYILYFIGPASRTDGSLTPPADATITATGYINQGNVATYSWKTGTTSLSYTTALGPTGAGYNMVGNPYPSTINLQTVINDNNTMIDNIYLLSLTSYIAYTAAGSSAPSSGYALSGEGFIVHAMNTGKTLTFKEREKAANVQLTGPALLMGLPKNEQTLTGLYMKMEQDSLSYDYCGIYFRSDWSGKYENGDAIDFDGLAPTVYMSSFTSDGVRTAVNHMPDYTKGSRVRLYANANTSGTYHLKIEGIRNIDSLYDIYLIDHYKKDSLDIRRYGSYAFDIAKADTSTFGGNRFELAIRHRPLPPYRLNLFTAQKANGGIKISWATGNEGNFTGFVLEKLQKDSNQFVRLYARQSDGSGNYNFIDQTLDKTGTNTYRLKQDDIDDKITYSGTVNVVFNTAQNITVYPNPAKESLQITMQPVATPAVYTATICNSNGIIVDSKSVRGNFWSHNVGQLSPGLYVIKVQNNDGKIVGQSKFSKIK
jgi:hypothetical protein